MAHTSPSALRPSLRTDALPRVSPATSPTGATNAHGIPLHSALATPRTSFSGGEGFPRTITGSSLDGGRYRRKVGFETVDSPLPDTLNTLTAQAKSEGYKRSRSTRVFLVAVSPDESGEDALDWLMSELVEDGDELIAMRVVDMGDEERHSQKANDELRDEAQALLRTVLKKNDEEDGRKISVIVEIVVGQVTDMILKMIALYRPDSLVVGTKGQRSRLQTWGKALGAPGMGSVSRFAVSHSPVPVIVVRPERKVKKTMQKRERAGKRGQYAKLVEHEDPTSRSRSLERSRSRERRSIDMGRGDRRSVDFGRSD